MMPAASIIATRIAGRLAPWLLASLIVLPVPALADGLLALESFIKNTRSGRASFVQTVSSPPREGQTARVKTSSGRFEFLRPSKLRFHYQKPFEQFIVADGQTLWLHDVDLNQVTARPQATSLGSTPVAIVASAADLKSLQAEFDVRDGGSADGLQWVVATPRTRDTALQSVRAGLATTLRGTELAVLEIVDSLGQRSVIRFAQFEVNPSLLAANFQFKVPAGADVMRQ